MIIALRSHQHQQQTHELRQEGKARWIYDFFSPHFQILFTFLASNQNTVIIHFQITFSASKKKHRGECSVESSQLKLTLFLFFLRSILLVHSFLIYWLKALSKYYARDATMMMVMNMTDVAGMSLFVQTECDKNSSRAYLTNRSQVFMVFVNDISETFLTFLPSINNRDSYFSTITFLHFFLSNLSFSNIESSCKVVLTALIKCRKCVVINVYFCLFTKIQLRA